MTSTPPVPRPQPAAPAPQEHARPRPSSAAARFLSHERRVLESLIRWVTRRPHGVEGADAVFTHGRDQATTMYGLTFACVVETVALSYLLAGRPVIHTALLAVDVYTVLFVLGLHAASRTRPHVLAGPALRIRQGANIDIHLPLDRIASIRRETRFTHEKKDGELNLPVGSQTSITLQLAEPVDAPTFLGAPRLVTVIRLHADDPKALYDAVTRARTTPEPTPESAPQRHQRLGDHEVRVHRGLDHLAERVESPGQDRRPLVPARDCGHHGVQASDVAGAAGDECGGSVECGERERGGRRRTLPGRSGN
ncbi:hypothetical protein [Streptomyces sp. NPDC000618]|uniref:hypothetical protein n=1 Tax=Streptomyces sp. NPDC000618 TaxID=3154265 RepID=UPI00332F95C7